MQYYPSHSLLITKVNNRLHTAILNTVEKYDISLYDSMFTEYLSNSGLLIHSKASTYYLYNTYNTLAKNTLVIIPKYVQQATCNLDGITLRTTRAGVRPIAIFLRNSSVFQTSQLVDITATDRPEQKGRFSVKYNFLSTRYQFRVTVEVFTNETLPLLSLAAPF